MRLPKIIALLTLAGFVTLSSGSAQVPPSPSPRPQPSGISGTELVVEDFSDIVTTNDLGSNDFGGNFGVANKTSGQLYGQARLACASAGGCGLGFDWNFTIDNDSEAFTGLFFSLFGLTDTRGTFDGITIESIRFPEHALHLDRIDGALAEPGGPRGIRSVGFAATYTGAAPLRLRAELVDAQGRGRFTRFPLGSAAGPQTLRWDFRSPQAYQVMPNGDLNLAETKLLNLVVERQHVGDQVSNPLQGSLLVHRLWLNADRAELEPTSDDALLDLVQRRSYQYFLDWTSRKASSRGLVQDRSTFGDLLSVGGQGFALPAHVIGVNRGWITREEGAERVLAALRVLDEPAAFGPERVGRLGNHGWFYHFVGVDGRRKLNFDVPETMHRDEAKNTVELSSIDTGLLLMGVLAVQSFFDRNNPIEAEIRTRAQAIYERVDFPFMLEPRSNQFYLGWKPNETFEGAAFQIPDATGQGTYSGTISRPSTLDYYTDEALIVALLAIASPTHPVPVEVMCALIRQRDDSGLVRTFPGSLFTFQFLQAFVDTRQLNLPACPGESPINWAENTRQAALRSVAHATANPRQFATYNSCAWGISAAEGPDDTYEAYGVPTLAASPPPEDGTITYYAMLSAVNSGADLRQAAICAVRQAWQRGHWHPRFGLPDAFNDEIAQATLAPKAGTGNAILRTNGPWVQRALFAIDQGPMLLHLENARSGLIWNLMANNPNLQRALTRLRTSGNGFTLSTQTSPLEVRLRWHDGTAETSYALARFDATSGQTTTITLPVNAASYTDSAVSAGGVYCYVLVPLTAEQPLGLTDMLCGVPGVGPTANTASTDSLTTVIERARTLIQPGTPPRAD